MTLYHQRGRSRGHAVGTSGLLEVFHHIMTTCRHPLCQAPEESCGQKKKMQSILFLLMYNSDEIWHLHC